VVRDRIVAVRGPVQQIALVDELLIRKVSGKHLFGMRSFADVVQLNRRRSVCEHALPVLKRFELRLTWIARECVWLSAETHRAHFPEEGFFSGSDNQRRAFGHVRANTAGMIVVMMCSRDVLYRLAWNRL